MKKEEKVSRARRKFNEKHEGLSEADVQIELLFLQKLALDKLKRIDTSTSYLFWFVFISVILSFCFFYFR